jgi:serine/threonine-protein kinase
VRPDEREVWVRADRHLADLLELSPEARRPALARLGLAPEVAGCVARLLAATESEGPLDHEPSLVLAASSDGAPEMPERSALAGRRFGAFELDEEIGRGGMAVVYRGHRVDGAFEQQVAVKLLGIGLLSTGAGERFRREQQLLARLNHPNIATMLDGGVAADGTPYLVMELLVGRPIDRYCDAERLDRRRRVELLHEVASAVAFAHRNLVVHRDLKPANILVTAEGRTKLLDFGIAKLIEADAAEPAATIAQERFLTPGYAAPEQVSGGAITTSTDVYGLGKVLEKLIDPAARPAGSDLANIAAQALRDEPERRYADARAFADDLESWLAGRPVKATPSSLSYRLAKAIRRHRGRVAAAAAVALVAAGGLAATLVQAERARREERTAAAVSDFLVELFQASDPAESLGREVTVREMLDRGVEQSRSLVGQPRLRARLLDVLGGVYQGLGRHERAIELWREALALEGAEGSRRSGLRAAALRDRIGVALLDLDRLDEAATELARALADRTRLAGARSAEVGETLDHLGVLAGHREDFAAAEKRFREALAVRRPLAATGRGRDDVADSLHGLSRALDTLGRFDEAETAAREALAIHRETLGADHPDVAHDLNTLANLLSRTGRSVEAEPLLREALAVRRKVYGESHPLVAQSLNDLAVQLDHRGDLVSAADTYRQALASYDGLYGPDHQATLIVRNNFARLLLSTGGFAEAEALFRLSVESLSRGDRDSETGGRHEAIARTGRGDALHGLGRLAEARRELERALAIATDSIRDVAFVAMAELELGRLDLTEGRLASAERRLATAEAGYRERYGAEHIRTARAAMWLGVAKLERGDREDGARLLNAALATQTALLPPDHPHLEATRAAVARIAPPL